MTGMEKDPLDDAAERLFGIPFLFPYQRLVVANILEAASASGVPLRWPGPETGDHGPSPEDLSGRDDPGRQIVILPTGAGKSLCFQLPAMLMEGPTLVIYPILGLMADQERRLGERGFFPVTLRGGQSREERDDAWEKIKSGRSKCIIANPEVLLTAQVLPRLEELGIVHVVIDEAHCVSEWGESFRPAYLEINRIIRAAGAPVVTAFTATASAPVLEKIERYLFGDAGARRIVGNPDRGNISYSARGCILRDLAVRDLLRTHERPAIVFCASRPGTEKLARYLLHEFKELGADWSGEIRFYHAGLDREEKKTVEGWSLRNPRGVLVATCAFGIGIDKADIRTVIHRDLPPSVEAYLQESGRAGRDGLGSRAILLWGPGDRTEKAGTEADRKRLAALSAYARNTGRCRRELLLEMLNYEGGHEKPESDCCDVCEKQASGSLREEASLRDFFRRNNRAYRSREAAEVLSRAEGIRWTTDDAKRCIDYLVEKGSLAVSGNPLWKHKVVLRRGTRQKKKH